jgi:V8-like Glu-specific endopeptidase
MHIRWSLVRFLGLGALVLSALGCAVSDDAEEPVDSTGDAIEDGEFTFVRPEIGIMVTSGMSFCTATLVSPNVVLTAAHCVDYRTEDRPGQKLGFFRVERSATVHHDFEYDATISYGRGAGKDDVALLRLKEAVPPSIARPAKIAEAAPTDRSNEDVTVFGYGCSNRPGLFGGGGHDDHSQKKQMMRFEMGPIRKLCPGDSGGPTVRGTYGDVFRVSSKMYFVEVFGFGRPDAFGDVIRHREKILDQIAEWVPEG